MPPKTIVVEQPRSLPPQDLPPEASNSETLSDFMDRYQNAPWQRTTLYLYQLDPPVTKYPGQPANVKAFKETFDEEEVRRIAPEGRYFMIIAKQLKEAGQLKEKAPEKFFFALAPRPQAAVNVHGNAQVAVSGTDPQALKTIEKLSSVGIDTLTRAAEQSSTMLANTFQLAMAKAINRDQEPPIDPMKSFTDTLVSLRQSGFLPERAEKPTTSDADQIVNRLKSELSFLQTTPKPDDFSEQIKKVGDAAALLGFTRATGAGEESIKAMLARNAPAIVQGLNHLADKIFGIMMLRAGAQPPATAPTERVNPAPAIAGTANVHTAVAKTQAEEPQESAEQTLDEFFKIKILELYANGADPHEAIAFLRIAVPPMVEMIAAADIATAPAFLQHDSILQELAKPAARKWLEGLLKAAKEAHGNQPVESPA